MSSNEVFIIMFFKFIVGNIRKNQKKIDKGKSPVNPFDKKAKDKENADNTKKINFSVLIFRMAKKIEEDTNIFIVFSKKLFAQAQPFKGIIIQKNNGTQL